MVEFLAKERRSQPTLIVDHFQYRIEISFIETYLSTVDAGSLTSLVGKEHVQRLGMIFSMMCCRGSFSRGSKQKHT